MKKSEHGRAKKVVAMLLVMILAIGMLAGCGGSDSDGNGVSEEGIRIALAYEPESLDIASQDSGDIAGAVLRMTSEPLLRNVDGVAEYGIAESYEVSEDGKIYTFHLRESSFADGTPVTADDVYYGVMRTLDPNRGFAYAYNLYDIAGAENYNKGLSSADEVKIKVIDDMTIEFSMAIPSYPLYFTGLGFTPVKQEAVEAAGDAYGSEAGNIIGNGPYTITEWVHESEIVLEKNENYWNSDAIHNDKVTFKVNADGQGAYDMMMADELDICSFHDMNIVDSLLESEDYENLEFVSGAQFLHINQEGRTPETGKWLQNADFRRALSYAIDREALVKSVLTGDVASNRLTSPDVMGVNDTFNTEYPYEGWSTTAEPEKAQEHLKLAMNDLGVTDTADIPEFTFLCTDNTLNMNYLNAVADMWEKTLGVRAVINAQPLSTMLEMMDSTGGFDFVKGGKDFGLVDWLASVAVFYLSGEGLPNNCNDAELDSLYYKALASPDWQTRKDNMFELEKYLCDNVIGLVTTWSGEHVVYKANIKGLTVTSSGYADYTFVEVK